MIIKMIEGAQNVIGKEQGYLGLPIRYSIKQAVIAGKEHTVPVIETAWEPTPGELELINKGHSIIVQLIHDHREPVNPQNLYVADTPSPTADDKQKAWEFAMDALERLEALYGQSGDMGRANMIRPMLVTLQKMGTE